MIQGFLDLMVRERCVDHQVSITFGSECPDRVHGGVHMHERCDQPDGALSRQCTPALLEKPDQWWPPRLLGIGIISLISWMATIGKVFANSRNHMPNQPNDPARIPQSAHVGLIWPHAQGM